MDNRSYLAILASGALLARSFATSIDFAITYFAVLRAGLVAVPLNPGYAPMRRHARIQTDDSLLSSWRKA